MRRLFEGIYKDIVMREISKPKHEQYSVVSCKYCNHIDKPLSKINNEYICKDCLKKEKEKWQTEN